MIEAFEMPELKVTILDVGCGYGPIGLIDCENLIQNGTVHMIDVNERALQLAKDNAELNRY